MHSSMSFLLLAVATTVTSKTVVINAGQSGFTFSPDSATANVGDVLEFHFFGNFHTAVQGDFTTPCQMGSLMGSGFDSGSIDNQGDGSGSVFQVMVQTTDPMWFYCVTPSHCQSGMVGVINPPASGDSLATYKSNAAGTSSSESVGKVQGGVVVPVPVGGSSSSSGPSSSSPPASSTTPQPASSATSSAPVSSAPSSTASSTSASVQTASSSTKAVSISTSNSTSVAPSNSVSAATATSTLSSATSSAKSSPSVVTASGGLSLMDKSKKFGLLSATIGLGIFALLLL